MDTHKKHDSNKTINKLSQISPKQNNSVIDEKYLDKLKRIIPDAAKSLDKFKTVQSNPNTHENSNIQNNTYNNVDNNVNNENSNDQNINVNTQKRKYVKKNKDNNLVSDKPKRQYIKKKDKIIVVKEKKPKKVYIKKEKKPKLPKPPKVSGGRRGRKPKIPDITMKPEEVIDFMIEMFPNMSIQDIKHKVLNGIEMMKTNNPMFKKLYVLDKIIDNSIEYYKDSAGYVLDKNAENVGQFYNNKVYLYKLNDNIDDEIIKKIIK